MRTDDEGTRQGPGQGAPQWPHGVSPPVAPWPIWSIPGGPAEPELDLVALGRRLLQNWRTVLVLMAAGGLLALGGGLLLPRRWEAQVLLAPAAGDPTAQALNSVVGQLGGLTSLVEMNALKTDQATEEALATLSARSLSYPFFEDEGILPILFADRWDPALGRWRPSEEVPTLADAFERWSEEVIEVEQEDSGLALLRVTWSDRRLAAQWANKLVERVNAHRRQEAIAQAESSLAFLKHQLGEAQDVGVREAIYSLLQVELGTVVVANARQQYAFRVIDPAVVPREEDYVFPPLVLLVLGGLALGLAVAAFATRRRAGAPREEVPQ